MNTDYDVRRDRRGAAAPHVDQGPAATFATT